MAQPALTGLGRRRGRPAAAALLVLCAILLGLRLWPHPPLRQAIPTSTAIYAKEGELLRLALTTDEQYRLWVPLSSIDPRLVAAVQLYEDRWFDWHPGVNPVALLRAALSTYTHGSRQGASTLTMQLARRLYRIPSQSITGKLRQIVAALWLEACYSKQDILEAYLNLAPYGGNIEGVGAASLIYFHKRAHQLTLPEVLALAVIPQNPRKRGGHDKTGGVHAERSAARARLWDAWLRRHPDAIKYQPEMTQAVRLHARHSLPFAAPHLTDRLLRDGKSGEVWTSVDMRLQQTLDRILAQYVDNHRLQGISNASALLLDRDTGAVRALVGSVDYFNDAIHGQVNGVEAKRSPGSTLKPFIYGLALDQGLLHPHTIVKDAPTSFGPFSPENFDGQFAGPISAQDALIRSRNIPAVAVAAKLARPTLYEFLKQAGVTRLASEKHYGLALALGGGELTMEELAHLYLMLANRGLLLPLTYERHSAAPPASAPRLLSPEATFITLQMLKANVRPDTGAPAAPAVAWKTGTSWGFRDAWTAGVFGRYVMVVWVGNFDGSGNPAFIGINTAAPLFFKLVDSLRGQRLDPGEPEQGMPENVARIEVCTASGDLPNAFCKDRSQTWYIPGKSPIKVSTLHRAVRIDTRTGLATCNDGPFAKTEVYEYWPTDLLRLFRDAGMPRRVPPAQPECDTGAAGTEDGPLIMSPSTGLTYTVRLSRPEPIQLRATASAAQDTLFWFAGGGLVGKSTASAELAWLPSTPGVHQVRVIDQHGRSDTREIVVEFTR